MLANWADFEKSLRRCRARRDVLVMLASLSLSYPTPLAKASGVDHRQLMSILHGRPPHYSQTLALVPMGLAREVHGPNGRAYQITERGRRKARQLTARSARAEARRRAARQVGDVHVNIPDQQPERSRERARAVAETSTWTSHLVLPPFRPPPPS